SKFSPSSLRRYEQRFGREPHVPRIGSVAKSLPLFFEHFGLQIVTSLFPDRIVKPQIKRNSERRLRSANQPARKNILSSRVRRRQFQKINVMRPYAYISRRLRHRLVHAKPAVPIECFHTAV